MEDSLPRPSQTANKHFNLALIAAGTVFLILVILLFILNYNTGSKTGVNEGSSAFKEELGKQPLPKVDIDNPGISLVIVNYRTVIDSVSPDTPEGTVISTDADGAGVPKFIVLPDTEFIFQAKGSEEKLPATLGDLKAGQEVTVSVRLDPVSKDAFLRRVTILEKPKTGVTPTP